MILGAHMSISKGFAEAARQAGEDYKANAMQIFTKSPRGGKIRPIADSEAQAFKDNCKKFGIKFVVAHSSYLLNFGKDILHLPWMLDNIVADFERLNALGGNGVVIHIGKIVEGDREASFKNIIENAKIVIEKTKNLPQSYVLENTAGQNGDLGWNFDDLKIIWDGLRNFSPRVKFCLDTAHLWGAGYDLSGETAVKKVFTEFDQLIGLKNVSNLHFNDSKKKLGSRVDRHDNLGEGQIGLEGMKAIALLADEKNIPIILETPETSTRTRLDDLILLRSLL
jgi:deoxyribonuclease-4